MVMSFQVQTATAILVMSLWLLEGEEEGKTSSSTSSSAPDENILYWKRTCGVPQAPVTWYIENSIQN